MKKESTLKKLRLFCIASVMCCVIFNSCKKNKCTNYCSKVLGVYSQNHATRIYVKYKTIDGSIHYESIHQANIFKCDNIDINPRDYLELYGGHKTFGNIKE